MVDALDLHFGAGVLADQDLVAGLDGHGDALAVFGELAFAHRHDLGFHGLLLGGIGDDDPSLDRFGGLAALEQDTIVKGLDCHVGLRE